MTNRKLHIHFRLAPRSLTLDDLELLKIPIFSEFCTTSHFWEATVSKRIKIDPHCQRRSCCALKVLATMYRLHWYCWAFSARSLQSKYSERNELCPMYQGCHVLTLALARLSCYSSESSRDNVPHSVWWLTEFEFRSCWFMCYSFVDCIVWILHFCRERYAISQISCRSCVWLLVMFSFAGSYLWLWLSLLLTVTTTV